VPVAAAAEHIHVEDIRQSLEFISLLQAASLDNTGLDEETLQRLRNPPCTPITIESPDVRLSLRLFLANKSSQEAYSQTRDAILLRYPENPILSHYEAKNKVAELSGISTIADDMCINACIGFTGPFAEFDTCPECDAPRYDPIVLQSTGKKVPQQTFHTIPIGPTIQALWRSLDGAKEMNNRRENTTTIFEELQKTQGAIDSYDDYTYGEEYLRAVADGRINEHDTVLMFSADRAQLYRSKQSDCWIFIWVILDLPPNSRYKKKRVVPAAVIPVGPGKIKVFDSFSFPSFRHLAALQNDGLTVWDASTDTKFISHPFLALVTADSPAMAHLDGLVGHQGAQGCRYFCGTQGRRKLGGNHYYPALLKPRNYDVAGCDHDDINPFMVPFASAEEYERKLAYVQASPNETQYKIRHRTTGISRPCLISGLSAKHRFQIPLGFAGDFMHLFSLNVPDLLFDLWRGTMDCDRTDSRITWDWAVLQGNVWLTHGKVVADTRPYLPGSFDRPPRNPAEKINSGYKAKEFSTYLYVVGPGVFYGVLPEKYWRNFCRLVSAVRLLHRQHISSAQLLHADKSMGTFVIEFERLYYQRRADRLHFCRPCLHLLPHTPGEVQRHGPGVCYAQWTMERTIGNLGEEIKSASKPYANLSQRAVLRAQSNALISMVPGFDISNPEKLPRAAVGIGGGFVLLRARDKNPRPLESAAMTAAIHLHFGTALPYFDVIRWARLRLPNGQIARSAWKELRKPLEQGRMARNIKKRIGAIEETFALISRYSEPNKKLYDDSHKTLIACRRNSDCFEVIHAKKILSVVGMIPLTNY
ncbi:hypothetical protein BOTBODRAFT_94222, partial [Botryobasidium botryosum FD-172 SS1]